MRKIFSIFAAVLFAGSMMADNFALVSSVNDLADGDQIIITDVEAQAAISTTQNPNNRATAVVTATDGVIVPGDDVQIITLVADASNFMLQVGEDAYLYAASNSSNHLKTSTAATAGENGKFAITIDANGIASVTAQGANQRNDIRYNTSGMFSCYGSSSSVEAGLKIFKKQGGDVPPVEDDCNWDEIAFLGNGSGNAAYTDRFKVCAGDPAPSSIVNIQSSFGTEPGIYVSFPSADFGAISLEENQYAIQGAGMLLYVSAFLYDAETEVTVVCQNVEYTLTVKNVNPETVPVEPTTCFDIYQMAKNDVVDLLNDVTVTYANGKNVWVVDGSASMLLYFSANTNYAPGDVLSGVAGVVDIYNGVYELKPSAEQAAAIVATPGEAPAAIQTVVVETADMNKYIVMPGIQFEEDAAFTEGAQSNITMNGVTVRNQFKNGYAFEAGKKYNVYGVVTIYQNNPQVYFITAEELDTTGFDNAAAEQKAIKVIENGQLFIIKNGVRYDAQGAVVR